MTSQRIFSASTKNGFSLIEILMVLAIFTVVVSFGMAFSMSSIARSGALSERDLLVSLLTQTRAKALANINESPHSLHIATSSYVFYEGATYDSDNITNKIVPMISKAVVTGPDSITFEQLTGNVSSGKGALFIENDTQTYTIEVNEVGRINW